MWRDQKWSERWVFWVWIEWKWTLYFFAVISPRPCDREKAGRKPVQLLPAWKNFCFSEGFLLTSPLVRHPPLLHNRHDLFPLYLSRLGIADVKTVRDPVGKIRGLSWAVINSPWLFFCLSFTTFCFHFNLISRGLHRTIDRRSDIIPVQISFQLYQICIYILSKMSRSSLQTGPPTDANV